MKKWVYGFLEAAQCAPEKRRDLFGGKGTGLVEMVQLGFPVPPGFILTTQVCDHYYQNNRSYPQDMGNQIKEAVAFLENSMAIHKQKKRGFGNPTAPLLVSVRSGARASMPGMMDTILNLGLNDQTVEGLKKYSHNPRFAYDSYRRFIQMYSHVVFGLNLKIFEDILAHYKAVRRVQDDNQLLPEDLQSVIQAYKEAIDKICGFSFPQDVFQQLWGAIGAVFQSWMNPRAIVYRSLYNIPESWGTAITVQAMVFGNKGPQCATGVAFTRNPSTGEKKFFGEYLLNAQGEDVVAGIRTPHPLCVHQKMSTKDLALEEAMPSLYQELVGLKDRLEKHYRDMQDIEFTVEDGVLFLLQTRNGKRTAQASLKLAIDMVEEGLVTPQEALVRFNPFALDQLLHPSLATENDLELIGSGLPASPGTAVGRVFFTAEECMAHAKGGPTILVRYETSPEDIQGISCAKGVLTARGGMTSHAAVVARGMGKTCVVGVDSLHIDLENKTLSLGNKKVKEGQFLTLDGATGNVFYGEGILAKPALESSDFLTFMSWADNTRRMDVRGNADTAHDAQNAFSFGAQGIGLCRTEHMFFDEKRMLVMREMILSSDEGERKKVLSKILPMHQENFQEIFGVLQGRPVAIRLLDPPLHEFLPRTAIEVHQLSKATGLEVSSIQQRLMDLHESNPMLGHRGCRLGITTPEIYDMQVQAIFRAAAIYEKMHRSPVSLEVMIPLIALTGELRFFKDRIFQTVKGIREETGCCLPYKFGAMIELPRAALKADKIAPLVDFLSFGTNDLTQTTFGLSRDDASSFLKIYRKNGIIERDPFISLDQSGVGELIKIACHKAQTTNPSIRLGVCGEHGGDPISIEFFESVGIHYVSCSPYRVTMARLGASQACLRNKTQEHKPQEAPPYRTRCQA